MVCLLLLQKFVSSKPFPVFLFIPLRHIFFFLTKSPIPQSLNITLISGEKKGEMLKFQQLKQNYILHNNFKTLERKEKENWQEE